MNSVLTTGSTSVIGALTVLLFPDYTLNIFKSAFIRVLESNARNIGNAHYKNSDPAVLTALFMVRSKLPALSDSYTALYESLVQFQAEFMGAHHLSATEQEQARLALTGLARAVSDNRKFSDGLKQQPATPTSSAAFGKLNVLIENYDRCLA